MKRIKMTLKAITLLITCLSITPALLAKEVAGVNVNDTASAGGTPLVLYDSVDQFSAVHPVYYWHFTQCPVAQSV